MRIFWVLVILLAAGAAMLMWRGTGNADARFEEAGSIPISAIRSDSADPMTPNTRTDRRDVRPDVPVARATPTDDRPPPADVEDQTNMPNEEDLRADPARPDQADAAFDPGRAPPPEAQFDRTNMPVEPAIDPNAQTDLESGTDSGQDRVPGSPPPGHQEVESLEVSGPTSATEPERVVAEKDLPAAVETTTADAPVGWNIDAEAIEANRSDDEAEATQEEATGPVPSTIVTRDDGSMLIDDRYVLSGSGTADDPYRTTWDMLAATSQTYVPRNGKTRFPEFIEMLNGKHVQITGYIAFPLNDAEPKEMLMMLNQWDGCCIGIPPTPYDAVEVKLEEGVTGRDRYATYGTVRGLMKVEPYLVGDWLVGLYLMDDAELEAEGHTAGSP